ncbi:glutamate--tRNA ligase [Rudaeicoccus suwonensis]|uniref:Glutamate--tRNA ligase n=1 Tax=Rudaeicoccus suwonensis TaxID=657409 RepID=A0A561E9C3_9MICO|nr:glutamate--tRNA ligase [Rudaeicoccus suwonensis]TWE12206.1 glutamyl-tRNA synthetase [Rudaeicoccus suwonensis]
MSTPTASPATSPRLRVAPSPTGDPHVGTAYMSMFDVAFAHKHGGKFIVRIEDTDRTRLVEGAEQQVYDTLSWLDLQWDEGPDKGGPYAPYRQSDRLATYKPYVDRLLADGHAYLCWCSTERLSQMREMQQKTKQPTGYDRMCLGKTREQRAELPGFTETPVVRMHIPDDVDLTWDDLVMGASSAPRPDDQVILKADGFPTYHLAVVVDDHEMGITHVVRGQDWMSSTPKQLLLYTWLDLPTPRFAHMPQLLEASKKKISKRRNPWARLTWFQENGYLPEALLNFLALQCYPPIVEADGSEREIFTFAEFTQRFEWAHVKRAGAIFNLDKLNWLNGHYIRELAVGDLTDRLLPFLQRDGVLPAEPSAEQVERFAQIVPLVQTRINLLTEATALVAPFFLPDDALPIADDARAQLKDGAAEVLDAAIGALESLGESDWTAAGLEEALRAAIVDGLGIKPRLAFGPLRTAVSGQRISPPLFESMEIIGKGSTLARLAALRTSLGDGQA